MEMEGIEPSRVPRLREKAVVMGFLKVSTDPQK
jgi:hypothetical protein